VTHGGLESQPIRTARREALVPQPCPTAVAATGISQHRQLRRCRVGCSSLLFPPASNGVDGKTRACRPTCQRRPHRGCSGRRRCHRAQLTQAVARESWMLTAIGSRHQERPAGLKSPMSSFFFNGARGRRYRRPRWCRESCAIRAGRWSLDGAAGLRRSKRIGSSSPPGSIRIIRSGRASAIARSTGRAGCLHDAAALGEVSGV
jgi:hypothetical protein